MSHITRLDTVGRLGMAGRGAFLLAASVSQTTSTNIAAPPTARLVRPASAAVSLCWAALLSGVERLEMVGVVESGEAVVVGRCMLAAVAAKLD